MCYKCHKSGHMARDCEGSKYGGDASTKLSGILTDDNVSNALLMRGIPWRTTQDEITEFFDGHGKIEITIEQLFGRRTGSVLVIFET